MSGFIARIFNRDRRDGGAVGSCCGQVSVVPEEDLSAEEGRPGAGNAAAEGSAPAPEILVITGSCCDPAAKPFDERAHRVVAEVLAENGLRAEVRTVSATDAMAGELSAGLLAELRERMLAGAVRLPAVLVDGELVSSGAVERGEVEAGLLGARSGAAGA